GRLEVYLASDGRNPHGVAIRGDPGHHALEQVARAGSVEIAEAQRVEYRDRPRSDREHVTKDPAHSRGGALERLDRGWVVVALDLEDDGETVPRIDCPRVFPWAHEHPLALGRQGSEELLRVLVGPVLRPME